MAVDKTFRGNASQFFIAGELCRRGFYAVVTLGNAANTDILCSNIAGTKFVHIQVKTYVPGNKTCSVGQKAEKEYQDNFFWVLGGIPDPSQDAAFEFYVIPAAVMSKQIRAAHQNWLDTPGKDGRLHKDNPMRTVHTPPASNQYSWDIHPYKNAWHLIEEKLADTLEVEGVEL